MSQAELELENSFFQGLLDDNSCLCKGTTALLCIDGWAIFYIYSYPLHPKKQH